MTDREKAEELAGPHEHFGEVHLTDVSCAHKHQYGSCLFESRVEAIEAALREAREEGERDGKEKLRAWENSWLAVVRARDAALKRAEAAEARCVELEKELSTFKGLRLAEVAQANRAWAEGRREGIEAVAKLVEEVDLLHSDYFELRAKLLRAIRALLAEPEKEKHCVRCGGPIEAHESWCGSHNDAGD